jgi:hypothetical protein
VTFLLPVNAEPGPIVSRACAVANKSPHGERAFDVAYKLVQGGTLPEPGERLPPDVADRQEQRAGYILDLI